MKVTSRPYLPPVPNGITDPVAKRYLMELQRGMQLFMVDLYTDLSQGTSTLTTFAAAPVATDVDQNQLVLRTDAGNEAIYANIGGTMKSVALT